ncbi:MAG: hypothetical protein EP326_01265, partial [Deltaproteobacteria bacterium]
MKSAILILTFFIVTSCSSIDMIKNGLFSDLRMDSENSYEENDYIDQLVDLGEDYLKSPGIEEIRLTGTSSRYLKSIYDRLVKNSELIF